MVDDASALNATAVVEVWAIPPNRESAEKQLQELFDRARRESLPISIGGARHSMGGHTIAPNGIVIDMRPFRHMSLDHKEEILTVGSGAIWHDVLAYLDPLGYSVAIMQSNDSFSVGGSISVNCHGWQFAQPPIASTVQSFRLMMARGETMTCSRDENPELFSLALGGYGLFGVILDVRLKVVPNVNYRCERHVVLADEIDTVYREHVIGNSDVSMFFARMDISERGFLKEATVYVMSEDPRLNQPVPPISPKGLAGLRRSIFLGSIHSEYGKRLRWEAETMWQPLVSPSHRSRNQLLDEGVEVFENHTAETTHILHEYFVPPDRFSDFIEQVREIVPRSGGNLLNATIRCVQADPDSFLRYADREMLSVVMLYTQPRTDAAETKMEMMTRELIDAALSLEGTYYLPYRLHATNEQFDAAYPQANEFFRLKRQYDPGQLFVNQFYLKYGHDHVGSKTN